MVLLLLPLKEVLKKKGWSVDVNSSTQIGKGFLAVPESQTEYGRGKQMVYSYGDVLYDYKQRLAEWGPRFEGQNIKQYDSPWDPITGIRSATHGLLVVLKISKTLWKQGWLPPTILLCLQLQIVQILECLSLICIKKGWLQILN
jgi:hypothetical protein